MSIFEAARAADLDGVRRALADGASAQGTDAQGFTPQHLAAMGANQGDTDDVARILALLLEAGASLEHPGTDGRTALYLAAAPPPEEAPDRPLSLLGRRRLRANVDVAFAALEGRGIVTGAGVGQNQDEGWDTVNEDAQRRATAGSTPRGAVFYTRADRSRAKRSGTLAIAFGAYDGDAGEIAAEVVAALRDAGLDARWDGDVSHRIEVAQS